MSARVLIVDDDRAVRDALGQTLELEGVVPIRAGSFIEAKDHIGTAFDGVVLSDIRMPGRDGFHLLDHVRGIDPELPVILLTGEGDIPMAVKAMERGAFDFLEKPCAPDALLSVLRRALTTRGLVMENRALKAEVESGDAAARMLFGTSEKAEALRRRARAAAKADVELLVSGPHGAGISKVAEVVHLLSPRRTRPFVKRQGAGLDRESLRRALDDAGQGSFFLDKIEALDEALQYELADRLEGAVSARLIAGSCEDLAARVDEGRFLADLYYRLDVMPLRIPALAERPEDIPVLFRHYVAQAAEQAGLEVPHISQELLARLMARDWPGNARALMSEAMRFVLGMDEGGAAEPSGDDGGLGLSERMAQVERSLLADALSRSGGQASRAAKALKLPRKTFYDKLARHGLKPEGFRKGG